MISDRQKRSPAPAAEPKPAFDALPKALKQALKRKALLESQGKDASVVAVKVLHAQYSADKTRRERFFRGAQYMARLRHPGIVGVIEEAFEDGSLWFVMDYLAGGDLRQAVLNDRLPVEERLRIVLEVGEALSFAHRKGVVHRDVKPTQRRRSVWHFGPGGQRLGVVP